MSNKEERIYDSIAKCQQTILELEELNSRIMGSEGENVRFRIETKHWYGYGIDMHFGKERRILDISKYTMYAIIESATKRQKERINSFINDIIKERKSKKDAKSTKS